MHSEEVFKDIDFSSAALEKDEYDGCRFEGCNFMRADMSGVQFYDCEFVNCDLSMARIVDTSFRDAAFRDCKMLGLQFEQANQLGMSFGFESCILNHASFRETKIKKTVFRKCHLHEADFWGTDLTSAVFDECDLYRALFMDTVLEKTDFRTAFNYSFDPERNRVKKARFSIPSVVGLLDKYDIRID